MTHLRRASAALLGLVVGLLVIEGAFRLRDHGAFPHLNIYRPDAKLGVRLRPGATEKISFSDNPVSSVRINAQGYRGADWPASQPNEIFVVGDSQAFGLGVDEDKAFAWRLSALSHRPVANAAVPTYGPDEYNAVLAEALPRRKPKTVLYVVNLANDLFEASHPNPTRHVVWDGWAVRKETAPRHVRHFPGRRLLFTYSHAFFALRGLWFKWSASSDEGSVPSEGTWRDLVDATHRIERGAASAPAASAKTTAPRSGVLSVLREARAHPGDIVLRSYGEGSRAVSLTADQIFEAIKQRDELARLAHVPPESVEAERSPLYAHLAQAKKLCDENGAELAVLVLPLDVQVSEAEWAKYPASHKVDLSKSRVLSWDVLIAANAVGARAIDAWDVLAAAEPGAFLKGDLHMTEKGHAEVAAAVARALAQPRGERVLPSGRSPVPSPAEWAVARTDASNDDGVTVTLPYKTTFAQLGCVYRRVREWTRIDCKDGAFTLAEPSRADALIVNADGHGSLTAALIEGQQLGVDFAGEKIAAQFRFVWPLDYGLRLAITGPDAYGVVKRPFQSTPAEEALCACEKKITNASDCNALYGAAEPGCSRKYGDDCESLLACARGDGDSSPQCLPSETMSVVTGRCVTGVPR